jgi:protoheme IX farnesyltransferase
MNSRHIHKRKNSNPAHLLRTLLLTTSIMVFLLIVLGGIVRVTESGGACPDWPTCFGHFTPPTGGSALLDYLHRLATLLAGGLLAASVLVAWRTKLETLWMRGPLWAALSMMGVQVVLGASLSLQLLPVGQGLNSGLHLALSLLILACILIATVVTFYRDRANDLKLSLQYRSSFSRWSLATLGAMFFLLVSGVIIASSKSAAACSGWPVCDGSLLSLTPAGWLNLGHRLMVLGTGGLVVSLVLRAWRSQRTQTPILVSTTAMAVLFFSQALLGAKMVAGYPPYLLGLHEATAVAAWAAITVQIVTVGLAGRTTQEERAEAEEIRGRKGWVRDLLMLTKPIVVALLLVTTYAGMVIGAQAWPTLALTFWTLLGGFMAAGGSGAINQYIDREDDNKMQRTQKRPIPSGRLTPGEGLAFGVGLALASFYLMVAMVNFLAALLSLAGIIYYVLLYSIFLKKTTVQNIVIGGGAGAIPPLVGWAAATGSLNIPSLFLFAVIFMWTPPHFWALALVRRKDYARAGVPMLPVIRGEVETRRQIFIYTLELVGLTLFLPLFGLGGSIYLIGAVLLGAWLMMAAWRVWRQGGNKLAWKMYRYSSMYLAFLFVVLMVDALL